MQLTVAIIGAPHGLKGEVRLDVRTDQPERRLAAGTALETDPPEEGPLTIARARQYKGATYVLFDECTDRTMAERLRGVKLTVETDEDEFYEEDAFYEHELRGLEALDPEGYELGEVVGLERGAAQDLLLVRETGGELVRVPFVRQIVTEVDLDDGCVVIDAPGGLFPDDDAEPAAQADEPAARAESLIDRDGDVIGRHGDPTDRDGDVIDREDSPPGRNAGLAGQAGEEADR